ncbi:MAG: peptidoglycan DD-metalloendopeptidase family protein, partial [Acetanaerobacterium sp.]
NSESSESPALSQPSQPSQDSATTLEDTPDSLQTVVPQAPQPDLLFVQPISGDIINSFSGGELVLDKTMNDWRTHNGVDFAAKAGTPVKAVTDGTVSRVYTDSMWGTVVEIAHENGMVSRYCSLTEGVTVAEGDAVEIGEVIGCVGDTALAEIGLPTHLHLEFLMDGEYADPLESIQKSAIS